MSDLLAALALVAVAVSVVTDLQERRISNRLLIAVLIAAVVVRVYYDDQIADAVMRSLAVVIMLAPAFVLRGMGAGDVKLLAVLAFCLNQIDTEIMIITTLMVGGLWGLLLMIWHRLHNTQSGGIAYAISIAIGTAFALL